MNVSVRKRMTVPEFLAWTASQVQGRYELVRGEVVAMAPETVAHVRAKRRAADALDAALKRASVPCEAFVDGLGVAADEETTYIPDALVNCGALNDPTSLIAPNPVIVIEVLSPSTRNIDTSVKLTDYFRVLGLAHYVVVDLAKRHVLHYRKQANGAVMVGIANDGQVSFEPPGISVPVAAFFG